MIREYPKQHLTVQRQTSGAVPKLPYAKLKEQILGSRYELSIAFVDRKTAKKLHREFKGKSTLVNILSFPIDDTSGEIIMSLEAARREAPRYGYTYHEYLIFLLIHGMTHLRGLDHGPEMDRREKKLRKKFGIHEPIAS